MEGFWSQLAAILGSEEYHQHSVCLTNDRLIMVMYVAAHGGIALAYQAMGFALILKNRVIADISHTAKAMYGAFILLCSLTHLAAIAVLFTGIYRMEVGILFATAAVSLMTAFFTVTALWGSARASR